MPRAMLSSPVSEEKKREKYLFTANWGENGHNLNPAVRHCATYALQTFLMIII